MPPKDKTLFENVGAGESFQQFLTDYTEFGEKSYDYPQLWDTKADTASIRGVWENVGKPYMKAYEEGELTEYWKSEDPHSAWDRAFFTQGENWPAAPDTVHYRRGNLDDAMAEFAHAEDYDTTIEERKSLGRRLGVERKLWGEDVYGETRIGERYHDTGISSVKQFYPSYGFSKSTIDVPFTGGNRYLGPIPFGKTTWKEFIPGVTPREDIPGEMAAHSITEEELWLQLESESGPRIQ